MMFTMKSSIQAAKLLAQRGGRSTRIVRSAATAPTATRSFAVMAQLEDWEIARNEAIIRSIEKDGAFHNTMSYSLSFSEESTIPELTNSPSRRMQEQLRISETQDLSNKNRISGSSNNNNDMLPQIDNDPLPRTITDALRPSRRAIVITETTKPFKVVEVNDAWEGLCEFSYVESKGKSLGSLLKGPETDQLAVTALMSQLLRGEEAGTVLTNYTKSGRKFQNRLRVGPLFHENGRLAYFVGVLQEMKA